MMTSKSKKFKRVLTHSEQQINLFGAQQYWTNYAASQLRVDPGFIVGLKIYMGAASDKNQSIAILANGQQCPLVDPIIKLANEVR